MHIKFLHFLISVSSFIFLAHLHPIPSLLPSHCKFHFFIGCDLQVAFHMNSSFAAFFIFEVFFFFLRTCLLGAFSFRSYRYSFAWLVFLFVSFFFSIAHVFCGQFYWVCLFFLFLVYISCPFFWLNFWAFIFNAMRCHIIPDNEYVSVYRYRS